MEKVSAQVAYAPTVPCWLGGLWQREELVLADGTADRTTRVAWGQTHRLFVDLRIPANRPETRGRGSFEDYSLEELLCLADQKGFAGHIEPQGDLWTWIRYIDFRPRTGRPDMGRLRLDGDVLYEEGDPASVLATSYREVYRRLRTGGNLSVALRRLPPEAGSADNGDPSDAMLVLIDDHFLFARDRRRELPAAESLRELLQAAGENRALIHAYLDCEISTGSIAGSGAWIVHLSTVPFREGRRLLPRASVRDGDEADVLSLDSDRGIGRWRVVESTATRQDLMGIMRRAVERDR